MKFNFDDISFANVQGYSMLKKSKTRQTQQKHSEQAGDLLDTLLTKPEKEVSEKDAISRFYSALKRRREEALQTSRSDPSSQKKEHSKNLAINKNTANRHGRT